MNPFGQNQVDKHLNLGFNLSKKEKSPYEFIANRNDFLDMQKDTGTYQPLKMAFENGWEQMLSFDINILPKLSNHKQSGAYENEIPKTILSEKI